MIVLEILAYLPHIFI